MDPNKNKYILHTRNKNHTNSKWSSCSPMDDASLATVKNLYSSGDFEFVVYKRVEDEDNG